MKVMKFADFVETIKSSLSIGCGRLSFVNPTTEYGVSFYSAQGSGGELPEAVKRHSFDEKTILAFTEKLGLDQTSERHKVKAAELLAMRNVWIAMLQCKFAQLQITEIRLLLTGEAEDIAIDYAMLTSGLSHPWILEKVRQLKNEEHSDPRDFRDPEIIQMQADIWQMLEAQDPNDPCYQAHLASIEEEKEREEFHEDVISHWIDRFKTDAGLWVSEFEPDAYYAELDIKLAKQEIKALQIKIDEQEAIIRKAQKPIKKFKSLEKNRKAKLNNKIDESEKIDSKKLRKAVARRFFTMWVASLIEVLEVDNSAGLAKVTSINKMTWWRWFNGITVPPYLQLSDLLNEKIKRGKYEDSALKNIPTYPRLEDIAFLVHLV